MSSGIIGESIITSCNKYKKMELRFSNSDLVLHVLDKIEKAITTLQERTSAVTCADDFALTPAGTEKLDAACMMLIVIGESIKNLDRITDKQLLPTYPTINWKQVMGVRDIIAHHYFDVDIDVIYQIIHDDLNPLLKAIKSFKSRIHS